MARAPLAFLGGLDARRFLARHWQKKPLLVRGAFPGFEGVGQRALGPRLPFPEMTRLAAREDVESRLVSFHRGRWQLEHGPFEPAAFDHPPGKWTLLVQGLDLHLPAAAELRAHFSFVPHARLDDVMVSYAPSGGSVGPHFDSYDVFLLQGHGRRRWQISAQRDLDLVPDAPLRILERFEPEEEWVVEPGDLLYLPPRCAHYGVAIDECTTYSIGFRAPTERELVSRFLGDLEEHLAPAGMYEDPGLRPQSHPSEIGDDMVDRVERMLARIRWDRRLVERFLGRYLSEPKPHVVFDRPRRPIAAAAFAARLAERGISLSPKSLMLLRGTRIFLNGEEHRAKGTNRRTLLRLADERALPRGLGVDGELMELLYEWYLAGYLTLRR